MAPKDDEFHLEVKTLDAFQRLMDILRGEERGKEGELIKKLNLSTADLNKAVVDGNKA